MMYPWQMNMLKQLEGFKPKEMIVMSAGRGVGKSMMTKQLVDRLMQDLMNHPVEDLVLTEGRVYGARYYLVEPVGGNWLDMEYWATQTYGTPGSIWSTEKHPVEPAQRWYMNNRKFWFRNEADRTMFVLKWR